LDKKCRDWDLGIPPVGDLPTTHERKVDDGFLVRFIRSMSAIGLREIGIAITILSENPLISYSSPVSSPEVFPRSTD
jgi:hypothetical protein